MSKESEYGVQVLNVMVLEIPIMDGQYVYGGHNCVDVFHLEALCNLYLPRVLMKTSVSMCSVSLQMWT